jgi:hypothetical protein
VKRILSATLLTVILAIPAFAANVYLKDGGVIEAKRVWRSGGKVQVLATRHTMTTFEKSEVNIRRTFPKKHRAAKTVAAVEPQTTAATPDGAAAIPKIADKKSGITLHALPKLPAKSPEIPGSSSGGAIKQHKKEMTEKTTE